MAVVFFVPLFVLVSSFAFAQIDRVKESRSEGSSFRDLRTMLYEKPLGQNLPNHKGLQTWDVVRNLFGSEDRPKHGLSIRSRRTFVDESDLRPPEPKWLHPRGACSEARWIVTEKNPATGLFQAGTNVPAIVRISTGDASSEYPTKGRIFGMAIKLFPTTDPFQKVRTTNIISLDQFGFERSARRFVFSNDDQREKIYFTNVAPAKSTLGKFLSTFFDRFDLPNFARPVYATAGANLGGGVLVDRVTPYELRFVAGDPIVPTSTFQDFRSELVQVRPRSLAIVIQSFDGKTPYNMQIGRLEFGQFVVSDFCDLDLHFHHSPIQDQWSKYFDYEVVKDLNP